MLSFVCAIAWAIVVIALIDCNLKKETENVLATALSRYAMNVYQEFIPNPNQMRNTMNEFM